jgi:CheY-like chemotaxis protein
MSYRVLVVDDDVGVREALFQMLDVEGYDVQAVENGRQAWERMRTVSYHCVLVDLRMPEMDGLALYQAVKQANPRLARRLVFCTGDHEGHLCWFAQGTGNRVLVKPFRMSELVETCREVCEG